MNWAAVTIRLLEIASGRNRHAQGFADCFGDRCDIRDHRHCDALALRVGAAIPRDKLKISGLV